MVPDIEREWIQEELRGKPPPGRDFLILALLILALATLVWSC